MGIDVVGGCPHLEADPAAANDGSADARRRRPGCPSTCTPTRRSNPSMLALEDLAERVLATGFPHPRRREPLRQPRSCNPRHRQREVAEQGRRGRHRVIALPHTNLFLQGREFQVAMPRGGHRRQGAARRRASTSQPAPTTCRIRSTRSAAAIPGDGRADDHDGPRAAGRRAAHGHRATPRAGDGPGVRVTIASRSGRHRARGDRLRPGRRRSSFAASRILGNRAFTRSRLSDRGRCPTLPSWGRLH